MSNFWGAYQFVIACYNLLYCDGNFGFYHTRLSEYYEKMAHSYLEQGDADRMFTCLEKSSEHAIEFDTLKDGMFTAFMVNKLEISLMDAVKTYTENQSGLLLKALQKDTFAHLQSDPRMQKIVEKLTPIAIL